ncbi:MAG TPA: hypothetical protein HA303_05975 [Candidatus Thalassarchaeaceae archaeon]|nr:MAG TPA: hypothetical protein D7H79_05950 [Candidatus Poseidoniales archaeon]HIH80750.1 hypothetical protein [Candidatus Thalassarchaeaceae archaeon]
MTDQENAPEVLPELSASATRLNRAKLEKVPWNHSGKHPGSRFFGGLLNLMFEFGNVAIFRRSENDPLPPVDGGVIYVATHINGLVDPMVIMRIQKKRVISLGRHDLITRPFIGWWSRRFGAQPVLRRAEIEAGVVDAEFAKHINERGMLTAASCLASGHSAVIMPEGKSHQASRLHALRTGSPRAALAAAAIAEERNLPPPVIQTVGLHWKTHYWFRTDSYVEFGEAIEIPSVYSADDRTLLASGTWVEPPREDTINLRQKMFDTLSPLTPDTPDWPTYRGQKLIANMEANKSETPLHKLSEEVHRTREVRVNMGDIEGSQLLNEATEAAEILHQNNLYADAISPSNKLRGMSNKDRLRGILGTLLMIVTSPIAIPANIVLSSVAKYMAERGDEGIDSRTTYFLLAGMFSPLLFWPPLVIISLLLLQGTAVSPSDIIPGLIGIFIIMDLTYIFLRGYDFWNDFSTARRRVKLSRSDDGERLDSLLKSINIQLGALK